MPSLTLLAAIASGGAIGAVSRFFVVQYFSDRSFAPFGMMLGGAYGTFAVNIIGSLIMGAVMAFLLGRVPADNFGELHHHWRGVLAVGFLGAFTTFSAFAFDVLVLLERKSFAIAAGYIGASVFGAFLALCAGYFAIKSVI